MKYIIKTPNRTDFGNSANLPDQRLYPPISSQFLNQHPSPALSHTAHIPGETFELVTQAELSADSTALNPIQISF